ncbi:MAG: HINT domain-containing protein, partial [Planctomycetaceae bacterium]|nr:HINT domain-containing protein [Planctomycetaceae bacterium]
NLENRPLCDCLPDYDQKTTPNGRWIYAKDLQVGDILRSHSCGSQEITSLEFFVTKKLVYNFLVDDLHNYAVGKNEILVHNTNTANVKKHKEQEQVKMIRTATADDLKHQQTLK